MADLARVRVGGNLFHPVLPRGAVYVGRRCPGLAASPFANPFRLKGQLGRTHPLRGYLKAAVIAVGAMTPELLAGTDLITPPAVRRWRHRHGRTWLGRTSPGGAPCQRSRGSRTTATARSCCT